MSNESAGADALTVMGVTGLSVAWRLAHVRYGAPEGIALAIAAVALVASS